MRSRHWISWRIAALSTLALAACGGGGGGSGGGDALLAIGSANRDTVAHAAAAGVLALGATSAVPLTIDAAGAAATIAADRRTALAGAGARAQPSWLRRVRSTLSPGGSVGGAGSAAARLRPLATLGPASEDCPLGGQVTVTLDDRDDDGDASAGDVARIVFDACRDDADSTVDGGVTATVVSIAADGSALTADLALENLAATTAAHSLALDGTVRLALTQPGFGPVTTIEVVARGAVTVAFSTHLGIEDTVTLRDGFSHTTVVDASVAPVDGNADPGRSTLTVDGTLESAAARGAVVLTTPAPLVSNGEDAWPRQGVLRIGGAASSLRATALSPSAVRLDLDTDDDGTPESSETVDWDWLL